MTRPSGWRASILALVLCTCACAADGGGSGAAGPAAPSTAPAAPTAAQTAPTAAPTAPSARSTAGTSLDQQEGLALALDFDSLDGAVLSAGGEVPDVSGNGHDAVSEAANSGALRLVDDGKGGRAVGFPDKCTGDCTRAILSVADTDDLDPGVADVRWGASMRIEGDETTKGSNVLQKGFAGPGGQFKLQIDRLDGRPSCLVYGVGDEGRYNVLSDVSVGDGQWHSVECRRSGTTLELLVDGQVHARRSDLPAELRIENDLPVRIGGKHVQAQNDQYFGSIDDVFVSIDR